MRDYHKKRISLFVLMVFAFLFLADFSESFGCDIQDNGEFSNNSIEDIFFAPVDLLSHASDHTSFVHTIDWNLELSPVGLVSFVNPFSSMELHWCDPPAPPSVSLHKVLSVYLI